MTGRRPASSMRLLVTGAAGRVAKQLLPGLVDGHELRLTDRIENASADRAPELVVGELTDRRLLDELLQGVDAVVHLAGASIAGRFTEGHKAAIRDTRIEPTRKLAQAAADTEDGPTAFVSASAIGFYGYDRGDALLCEDSVRGEGFLADVVADWEAATAPAADAGLRVVNVRTGVVQAAAGGTLRLLRPLFLAGLGGRLGSGQQWLSWIGIDDLLDVYYRALYDGRLSGPVNAVGPEPVRNSEYTKTLAGVLHRPALLPVPSFGPRILLGGQGVRELAEADQRVVPTKLTELGHRFRHPTVSDALAHQLGHG